MQPWKNGRTSSFTSRTISPSQRIQDLFPKRRRSLRRAPSAFVSICSERAVFQLGGEWGSGHFCSGSLGLVYQLGRIGVFENFHARVNAHQAAVQTDRVIGGVAKGLSGIVAVVLLPPSVRLFNLL